MKKKSLSRIQFVFIWFCLYIAVILFGLTISVMTAYVRNQNMIQIAQSDMKYYIQNGHFNSGVVTLNNASNFVYAADGTRIASLTTPTIENYFIYNEYSENFLPRIQNHNYVYKMAFNPNLKSHFIIVVALPMEDGGMFLFLRELFSLNTLFTIMFFSVTFSMILAAFFMAFIIRRNKDMEKMQREYVDNISHELKSPIASVRALAETMYDGLVPDEDKRRKYCGIMLNELTGLEHTVSNMLELSRIQSHQTNCRKNTLSSFDIFASIIDKYSVLCDDMGLSFTCSPELGNYPSLHTNKALAARILDILLDNAVKFAGVEGSVSVTFTNEFRQLIITVKNSGSYIAPADQPHIFERFYKGDKAHNEKGSGLGLAIASEIAACLDEKLWLRKSTSSGTEFSFTLQKKISNYIKK